MREKVREIITWILENGDEESSDTGSIFERLEEMGYSSDEIGQALSLLEVESIVLENLSGPGKRPSSRIFSSAERNMLDIDAQGWLLAMRSSGAISETQLSLIIETAGIEDDGPVSLSRIIEIASIYTDGRPDGSSAEAEAGTIN